MTVHRRLVVLVMGERRSPAGAAGCVVVVVVSAHFESRIRGRVGHLGTWHHRRDGGNGFIRAEEEHLVLLVGDSDALEVNFQQA